MIIDLFTSEPSETKRKKLQSTIFLSSILIYFFCLFVYLKYPHDEIINIKEPLTGVIQSTNVQGNKFYFIINNEEIQITKKSYVVYNIGDIVTVYRTPPKTSLFLLSGFCHVYVFVYSSIFFFLCFILSIFWFSWAFNYSDKWTFKEYLKRIKEWFNDSSF